MPLTFISAEKSKYKEYLKQIDLSNKFPIGVIDDIEIMSMHYHSEKEALNKWNRRCSRINYNALIVKFNDQYCCTREHIEKFMNLPYKNKLFFSSKKLEYYPESIYIKQFPKCDFIQTLYEPFGANIKFNLNKYLNDL